MKEFNKAWKVKRASWLYLGESKQCDHVNGRHYAKRASAKAERRIARALIREALAAR